MSQGIPPHRRPMSIQIATASIFAEWALAVPAESDFPILTTISVRVGSLHGRGRGRNFLNRSVRPLAIGKAMRDVSAAFLVSFPAAIIAMSTIARMSFIQP